MLQYPRLNKRLVYAMLEAVIASLFPDNKFNEILDRLHARSQADAPGTGGGKAMRPFVFT